MEANLGNRGAEDSAPGIKPLTEDRAIPPVDLPDRPLISIRARKGWSPIDLRSLWNYRELLYFLTWRDVKVRYKQTALGAAWAVIQPLFTMIIFTIFFGRIAGLPSDQIPYPLFAFSGLLLWVFFSNSVTASGNSLIGSANLITKVYFPRMIIPGAAVAAGLVDLIVGFGILFLLMAYYGVGVSLNLLAAPLLILLTTLLAIGVGMWMSALNVRYRDIRYALPFGVQLLMFATPVIYPSSMAPVKWRWLLQLNPLTGIIEGFRAAVFGRPFDWASIAISFIATILILIYAAYDFRRMERTFADII